MSIKDGIVGAMVVGGGSGGGGGSGTAGVSAFNGRTGAVFPQEGDYTAAQVGADPTGTASDAVVAHNQSEDAHENKFSTKADQTQLTFHIENTNNPHAVTAEQVGAVPASLIGQSNGIAELDESGLVPASQLPGFVDDVVDAYVVGSTPYAADWLSLTSGGAALTPAASTIYLIVSAGDYQNQQYRWSGTQYALISASLALGETADTAYRGDRGKTAYDHSQITNGNPHGVTAEMIGAANADTTGQALQTLSDEIDNIISGASPVTLPVASETKVGGVKVGSGLSVTADGTLSADSQLPPNGTDGQLLGAGESGATNWVTTDATPTESSANPVQSGGVFNALAGKADLTLSNLSNYQKALRNLGGRPNRNLADNAYFVGGGSQQGDGQFPINQRGQTSYTVLNGSCIDRWKLFNSPTLALEADAIALTSSNTSAYESPSQLRQILSPEAIEQIKGRTVTLSVLTTQGLFSGPFTISPDGSSISGERISMEDWYADLYANPSISKIEFRFVSLNPNATLKIRAVKLELGPIQTLAYQDEDGNWQLFEKPDYGEELAKCKRYLQMINTRMLGVGFKEPGNGGVWMSFGFPVEMRVNPTVTVKMLPQFAYGDVTATGTVWTAQTSIGMSCSFALPEGNGITDYRACVAQNTGIVFELSAEL